MKWLKKHKDEITHGVQVFIILEMMVNGFWLSYMWIWFKFDLPIEWWSIAITLGLAVLSMFGVWRWVANS